MARILSNLNQVPPELKGGAVAIGNFDGVHWGHANLIEQLVQLAHQVGGPSVVLTFDPPPSEILFPDREHPLPLTTMKRRAELLGNLNVDTMIAYPTDECLLNLSPESFFRDKIVEGLAAKAMVEGPNFQFGKDRTGTTETLKEFCDRHSMRLKIVEATLGPAGSMVSSTRVRQCLLAGDIASANQMLTHPYQLSGIVGEGAKRGRELGFPTANLHSVANLIPKHGVYAGTVDWDGREIPAAIHIGPNPTFGEQDSKVEIHLIGWSGDLYAQHLDVDLRFRIRDIRQFESIASLREQLHSDIRTCLNMLNDRAKF